MCQIRQRQPKSVDRTVLADYGLDSDVESERDALGGARALRRGRRRVGARHR